MRSNNVCCDFGILHGIETKRQLLFFKDNSQYIYISYKFIIIQIIYNNVSNMIQVDKSLNSGRFTTRHQAATTTSLGAETATENSATGMP